MDLAFFLRAERMLSRNDPAIGDVGARAGVDYDLLVATLGAHQSASATARAARERAAAGPTRSYPYDRVAELLLGGGNWREAKRAQGGSFHRGAGPNVNANGATD
jgi:hypothetical protein